MDDRNQWGVTLIEVLLALSLLAILITVGVPSFGHWLERQRLQAAARTLAADLRRARQEAVTQSGNQPVYLHFLTGGNWCYGFSRLAHCDCRQTLPRATGACLLIQRGAVQLMRRDAALYHGIALTEARFSRGSSVRFDPLRGLATGGHVTLSDSHRDQLQVRVSPLGRIRLCTPGNRRLPGIDPC